MKHTILIRLAAYGLRVGLLFGAISAVLVMVFGSPTALKTALKDSGAYSTASNTLATQAGKAAGSDDSHDSGQAAQGIDKTAVSTAAKASFGAGTIQSTAEKAIDGTYGWLEGKTDKPDININLQSYIDQFTESLGGQAVQRAQSLPACTAEQLKQIDPKNVDVFNLPCLPPGVDLNSAKDQAIAKATESNDFLQKPVLSTDSLPKDEQGKTAVDKLASAPKAFQWGMRAPLIFGILAVLCAGLIYWLMRSDWRAAVKRLARSFLGVGITLLVIAIAARLIFAYLTKPGGFGDKLAGGDYRDVILSFVTSIEKALSGKLLMFGIVYTVVAIIALVVLKILKPAHPVEAEPLMPDLPPSSSPTKTSPNPTRLKRV